MGETYLELLELEVAKLIHDERFISRVEERYRVEPLEPWYNLVAIDKETCEQQAEPTMLEPH